MTSLSHQLSFLGRHRLAQVLDQDNIRGCDWRALVEQMGFTYEMITFLRNKKSPTMALLEEWEMKEGSGANINTLIAMIEEIDNIPALEVVKEVREKLSVRPISSSPRVSPLSSPLSSLRSTSSNNYPEKSPMGKPLDPGNLSAAPPPYHHVTRDRTNEDMKHFNQKVQDLVLDEQARVMTREETGGRGDYVSDDLMRGRTLSDMDKSLLEGDEFDVFLSFASTDHEFAEEMRLRLEHRAGINCYIPSEGLMPGMSFQDEIADKIKRGCRKTVVIMSPDYIDSPWCTYEARLAHHKNPDPRRHVLIPVMYKKCKVPDFIAYLFYLDYPRYQDNPSRCEQYFWTRLYKSIKLPQR